METIQVIWKHGPEVLAWFGALVLTFSATVKTLQGAEKSLQWLASKTETKADDRAVAWYHRTLESAASGLAWVSKLLRPFSLRGKGKP